IDEANGPTTEQLQCICHDTLPWLISFSLGGSTRMETSTPPPIETTTTTVPRPTAISVVCHRIHRRAVYHSAHIHRHRTQYRSVVSAIPCLQCCRRLRLYCRPLEDEAMGFLQLHRFRRPQSGCDVDDGCVEGFRTVDSGHRHRHCFHTLVKDAMTMPPNHALQPTAAGRRVAIAALRGRRR